MEYSSTSSSYGTYGRRRITKSPVDFSSSNFMSNPRFQCSICWNLLIEPVTTPSAHNFCKSCLTYCWDESYWYQCPMCDKTFETRPDLEVNYLLSSMISQFRMVGPAKVPAKPREIPCDMYLNVKQKALQSCLDCNTIRDVENMEIYICPRHKRPLELFCRDDKTCVSLMMQDRLKKTEDIKQLTKLRKESIEEETTDSVDVFDALISSIERRQDDMFEMMEEKKKAIEGETKGYLKEMEQEITELKRRDTELEQLSHTENHLQILQIYPSVCRRSHTETWTDVNTLHIQNAYPSGETLRQALSQLQKTMENKINEMEVKRIKQYAVDVTLDPATAHNSLVVSDDGKQVTKGNKRVNLFGNQGVFYPCTNVLGTEGFSSGRFYYEVLVSGKTSWGLGVARRSITNDMDISLNPKAGFWVLGFQNENGYKVVYTTSTILFTLLEVGTPTQKVGVFVDYEEGLVSFYDVKARSHIYSFTGQLFSGKLYPYFNPGPNDGGKNSAPLIILSSNHSK